ncbi:MAG: hypothetical protein ACK4ZM_04235 [bacterium]
MSKSKFVLIFLLSITVFYFFVEYMTKIQVKINLISSENTKQLVKDYLSNYKNDKIIINSEKPDIVIKIDDQGDYWIVDIKIDSYGYAKIIPLLNILMYKIFFIQKGLTDPVKINVQGLSMENYNKIIFSMVLNMVFWGLLSYVSSEIIRDKLKKTALIFDNVNLNILSKCVVVSLLFFVLFSLYNFWFSGKIEAVNILLLAIFFSGLCYIYGVLSWFVRNVHLMSIINLMVGFTIILYPILGSKNVFEVVNLKLLFVLFFICLLIGVFVWKKNSYLQKIVWE